MFKPVADSNFVTGEHHVLHFWNARQIFQKLRQQNSGKPRWSFLDGPITANNPMGVHHAWGRTYKDAYQRFYAMTGHELRYQNGFDCQGLWVEVEVEKQLGLGTKTAITEYGIDRFVNECKRRVLRFAARQTEQSIRLGYWMDWDDPNQLRMLAEHLGTPTPVTLHTPAGPAVSAPAHQLVEQLGRPEWGGSYFTFSTENNETIWTFLKKCFRRGKIYQGHDVMPWSGRGGSAYSQMEIAEGRKLTTHKSVFVRLPINRPGLDPQTREYLLVWTTTPWTLTSNVACAVNPDLEYLRVRSLRDHSICYFAKDNLNYPRLATEFRDGFGRPEWKWPEGVPKLKTIAQILKEQGGFEELETLRGADLIGWTYAGPFDDLPAQQQPGGVPADEKLLDRCGASSHRVIDGGRDSRGNPNVVAGEGTGIVHIAPGCGDIDHKIGTALGLPVIAPLNEDGTYSSEFGEFSGRTAIAPDTAELVFERLKQRGMLVAVETYPHIYPHCWRTGDELVFRLVDEWFINMDWRSEIQDVTRQIRWLPESINGQERELEWLAGMGDWMISKKRFWGLALPIWVDEQTGDFEVIGSLAELKDRAVEGWDQFAGNTPHRPWIDHVKIRNPQTGNLMRRIPDVGNPWLDAGIVPFSTMGYNHNRSEWQKWYPADLVTECFPGQFRNWFYSLLSLSTMMRHDEADSAAGRMPFRTLLGHRLVQNEQGRPMHKSDGTAIWFEEAAEQLGVDTMRWMYLAQNPAVDLRFGTRHPDQPVTLQTPNGPASQTHEGVPTCLVTSSPADDTRRRILIPLWNCYKFFVDYAAADEFSPSPNARKQAAGTAPATDPRTVAERPEIDRWILSRLQALIETANREMAAFNAPAFCAAAADFIDDLSNWYIRRNRRRFWRSRDASDADKAAAYETLYEVLVTLCRLLAPCIPFLTERMYQNLVLGRDFAEAALSNPGQNTELPESVHLCDYPAPNPALLDNQLNQRMAAAQKVVRLGHQLREDASLRVRQPLAELRFAASHPETAAAVESLADVVREELNIHAVLRQENLDDLVAYSYKPNLKTLGPRYGKLLNSLRTKLPELGDAVLAPLRRGTPVTIQLDGQPVELNPEDVLVSTQQAAHWMSADDSGIQVAISTVLTPQLVREGMSRDFVRHVQQLRKDAGLNIQDRIAITWQSTQPAVAEMAAEWNRYICEETLADSLQQATPNSPKSVSVGDCDVQIAITRSHP
jgi:isoleucyl-tRNA synthetase